MFQVAIDFPPERWPWLLSSLVGPKPSVKGDSYMQAKTPLTHFLKSQLLWLDSHKENLKRGPPAQGQGYDPA